MKTRDQDRATLVAVATLLQREASLWEADAPVRYVLWSLAERLKKRAKKVKAK